MKLRFTKGVFKLGRPARPKEEPLTPGQEQRLTALLRSLKEPASKASPKPAVKTAAAKPARRLVAPKDSAWLAGTMMRALVVPRV